MTPKQLAFLRVVSSDGPAKAGYLGSQAYGGGKPQFYARPAANMLYRLAALGLVVGERRQWGTYWYITSKGVAALRTATKEK